MRPILILLLAATMSAAAQAPEPDEERGYRKGGLGLLALDSLVLVYPAGEGQDVAINRRSAVRRAAFLSIFHGVDAEVVADTELTEAHLGRDLLLIGWDNRLLERDEVRQVFRRTGSGFRLLDIDHPYDGDLFFFHVSPFSPNRLLAFWSRIDPEIDRLNVFPVVGSDWAFFRDYLIVRQGMFRDAATWPPQRNKLAEKNHTAELNEARGRQRSRSSEHFTARYDPEAFSEDDVTRILEARERALARAASQLGVGLDGSRVALYLYRHVEEKTALTGVPDAAHAVPRRQELHVVRELAFGDAHHEEIHLVAWRLHGASSSTAMYEGLALDLEGRLRGQDLQLLAALLLERTELPPLATLLHEEKFRAMNDDLAFTTAGLLARWIRTEHSERLGAAYRIPDDDPAALAAALDLPTGELDARFGAWVRSLAAAHADDMRYMNALEEARDHHLVGNYAGVAEAMARALRIRPDDLSALLNLANAQLRIERYSDAVRHLERVVELARASGDRRYESRALFDLGRVYDLQGLRDQAVARYESVLALPDDAGLHELCRAAIRQPVTRDSLD